VLEIKIKASIAVKHGKQSNETVSEMEVEGDYGWNQGTRHRVESMKETMTGKKKIGGKHQVKNPMTEELKKPVVGVRVC